jgi:anti-sigma factor RsiW
MKDCIRFAPMIGARPGELAADEAKSLDVHLAACGACRALAADFAATDGMVSDALLARANSRDFSTFADEVMERVGQANPSTSLGRRPRHAQGERMGFWAWVSRHRAAAAGTLVPVLAALALLVYVRVEGGRDTIALLELSSEGEVTTILQTSDGPVVLLVEESGS